MQMVKKVLVYGITANVGGVETCLINYCRNVDPSKIQFDFLLPHGITAYNDLIEAMGGKFFFIAQTRIKNIFAHPREVTRFFRKHASEYDAVWYNHGVLGFMSIPIQAKRFGIKKIIIHSHVSSVVAKTLPLLYRILHRLNRNRVRDFGTDFWACSKQAAEHFYPPHIVDKYTYQIIPNAIDVDKFCFQGVVRSQLRDEFQVNDNYVVLHVGRFSVEKNQSFLLDVFRQLLHRKPNAVLWLVGDGSYRAAIEKKAYDLGLLNSILFLGNRNDVHDLMQAADLFVCPSLHEGFGMVIIEAQAAGLPCVISDVIPMEVDITNLINRVSLDVAPIDWATKISEIEINTARDDFAQQVRRSGYDIKEQAKVIQNLF